MISTAHMLHVWNIYQHLPHKSPSFVGKYTIHGAYGQVHRFTKVFSDQMSAPAGIATGREDYGEDANSRWESDRSCR
jgi:hypothetical protein